MVNKEKEESAVPEKGKVARRLLTICILSFFSISVFFLLFSIPLQDFNHILCLLIYVRNSHTLVL